MDRNRRGGFTLLEMLTVIGILGIMIATAFTGLAQAQRQARNAKAQAEVRQLINAWFAYEAANDDWPSDMPENGDAVETSKTRLSVLLGESEDASGERRVYLNAPIRNGYFRDPWGTPYKLKITSRDDVPEISDTFFAAVTFPNRNRPKEPQGPQGQ